jgi:hypothetical protein
MIHASFAIMWLFFHMESVIFNTRLPTFRKTLYTSVVKLPVSTTERITKTRFQFVVICKMASTQCIHYKAELMEVQGCQTWAVSGMGKNMPHVVGRDLRACLRSLRFTPLKTPDPTSHCTHINGMPPHTVQAPMNFCGTNL